MTLLQPSLIIVQPQTYNLAFSNNLFYPVYSSFPTYSVSYSIPTNSYQPSFFQPSYSSPYLPTYPLSYPSYSTSYLAYSPNLVQYSNYQNSYCSSSLSQQPNSQTFSNYQVPLYPSPNPTLNYVNFPEIKKMDNFSNPIQIEGSYQNLSLQKIANYVPINNLRDVACQTDNNSDQQEEFKNNLGLRSYKGSFLKIYSSLEKLKNSIYFVDNITQLEREVFNASRSG